MLQGTLSLRGALKGGIKFWIKNYDYDRRQFVECDENTPVDV
jgi:hypothetical protein